MALVRQNGSLVVHGNALGTGQECCCEQPGEAVCLLCEEYEEEIEVSVEIYDGSGPCETSSPMVLFDVTFAQNIILTLVSPGTWEGITTFFGETPEPDYDVVVRAQLGVGSDDACSLQISALKFEGFFYPYPPRAWPFEALYWFEAECLDERPDGLPDEVEWPAAQVINLSGVGQPLKKSLSPYCRPPAGMYQVSGKAPYDGCDDFPAACQFRIEVL